MDGYTGIVYDLDGTLVSLDVDWGEARADTVMALREQGIPDLDQNLWELLERGQTEGFESLVERELASHEQDGARTATALPAAELLPHDVPTGVCSLNCESACRIALETHGLDGYIDVTVGRDTVGGRKPDPGPLLETIEKLGVSPEQTVFIGDTERDALTAERAGTDFRYVEEHLDSMSQ